VTGTVPVFGREIVGLARMTPGEGSRPVLEHIRLQNGYAYAADGFALMGVEVRREPAAAHPGAVDPGDALTPAKTFAAAIKRGGRHGLASMVQHVAGSLGIKTGTTVEEVTPLEATYPDMRRIVDALLRDNPAPLAYVTVSVQFLGKLAEAMKDAMGSTDGGMDNPLTLAIYGPEKPLIVQGMTADGRREAFAVLMPMVVNGSDPKGTPLDRLGRVGRVAEEVAGG